MKWISSFTLAVAGCLLGSSLAAAQLVVFSLDGASGDEVSLSSDAVPANAAVSDLVRGGGVSPASGASAFAARSWALGGFEGDDYFGFSIEPNEGFQLELSTLEFDERRSGSGIRAWEVRTSLDGFSSALSPGSVAVPDNTSTRVDQVVSFPESGASGVVDELMIRIYGYGAEGASGTWRVDNIELFGNITPVPEPRSAALCVGALLLAGLVARRGIARPKRQAC